MLTKWLLKIRLGGLRRSPARGAALLLSIAGLSLAIGPSLLAGLREAGRAGDAGQALARMAWFFSLSFLFWVISGGIFQFHLGWQIELPRMMRLPVSPRRIYLSKSIYGLFGPWLLVLLPAWLWMAWRQSASGLAFLLLLPALALFAILCNQAAGILSLLRNRLTSGMPWMILLFCAFGLLNTVLFALIRSRIGGDHSTIAAIGRTIRGLGRAPASMALPGELMARLHLAAGISATGRMLAWEALLLLLVLAAAGIEMAMLRRVHWKGESFASSRSNGKSKNRGSWLAPSMRAVRGRPEAALFLKELHALLENKSLRILLFFFFSYLPLLVFFIPPPTYALAEVLCMLPVLLFSHIKSNLLGGEHFSRKIFFTSPAGIFAAMRMKNHALNLLVGLLLGATLLVGAGAGNLAFSDLGIAMIGLYCAALFYVWDMAGCFCSARYPEPTDTRGVVLGSGLNPGGFVMILGMPLPLAVFMILQWGCARAGHPRFALIGGGAIVLLLAGGYHRIYLPWLRSLLAARHEILYDQLAEPIT
ncbi:MAG: hypothetical protein ACKVX9_07315 [Blastocatellia bacterium]